MKAMKAGTLESGRSNVKVTNPKQGIGNWSFGGAQGRSESPARADR